MQILPREIVFGRLAAWGPPLAVAIVALAMRLHCLADKPLWLDEVATLHRATIGFSAMVAESLRSKHYPTYFALLWLVAKLGVSPWLLRLPSAIFGAIAAGLVVGIGREGDKLRTGIAAGLLLALSPFDVQYGQEARSYTLVAALILVALWGLVRLARQTTPDLPRQVAPGAWLAYGGGTLCALCVLNVAVPWLVASNVAATAIAWRTPARRVFLRRWAFTQAAILVLWLPAFALVVYESHGAVLEGPGWALSEKWIALWSIIGPVYLDRISAFITYDVLPSAVPELSLALAALAGYGVWLLRRRPDTLIAIACAVFVLPLLLLLLSRITPVLVPRYFAWSAGPFFILAGAGIAQLTGWRYGAALTAFVLLAVTNLGPYYDTETKPRWDLATARLASETQPGDVVLFSSWSAYYVATTAFATQSGLDQHNRVLTWRPGEAARLEPGHALWAVFGRVGQGKMEFAADYAALLSRLGKPASEEHIGRYISIWRFVPPDAVANAPSAEQSRSN